MGRLFVIDLEEPVYRCKHCKLKFAVYGDPINQIPPVFDYSVIYWKLYYFSKCFNVVVGTDKVMIENGENENDIAMLEVFCICCGSHIGFNYESVETVKYNEGNFFINRFKLNGPPDGSDDEEDTESDFDEEE